MTDTKENKKIKKKTHIIVKSIHSSLRSESKTHIIVKSIHSSLCSEYKIDVVYNISG